MSRGRDDQPSIPGPGEVPAASPQPPVHASEDPSSAPRADVQDPASVRVTVASQSELAGDVPLTVGRGPLSVSPRNRLMGAQAPSTIDGRPHAVRLERRDDARGLLVEGDGIQAWRTRVVFGPARRGSDARERREIVVDGWRFELEVEQEQRARLREKAAGGGRGAGTRGGRVEIRAMIPGKVVAVDVEAGEAIEAGRRLLVLEAMKMQNEVHAERAGTVERVAVTEGQTVELGDLLVTLT